MMEIKRYELSDDYYSVEERGDGSYVLYTDHLAAIETLKEYNAKLLNDAESYLNERNAVNERVRELEDCIDGQWGPAIIRQMKADNAALKERVRELEGELDRLTDINIDIDSDRSKTRADNAALRKELAKRESEAINWAKNSREESGADQQTCRGACRGGGGHP